MSINLKNDEQRLAAFKQLIVEPTSSVYDSKPDVAELGDILGIDTTGAVKPAMYILENNYRMYMAPSFFSEDGEYRKIDTTSPFFKLWYAAADNSYRRGINIVSDTDHSVVVARIPAIVTVSDNPTVDASELVTNVDTALKMEKRVPKSGSNALMENGLINKILDPVLRGTLTAVDEWEMLRMFTFPELKKQIESIQDQKNIMPHEDIYGDEL